MSTRLPLDKVFEIEEKLKKGLSVLQISKDVKVSRNTIKKYFAHHFISIKKRIDVEPSDITKKSEVVPVVVAAEGAELPAEAVIEIPLIESYQFSRLVSLFREYKSSSDPLDPYRDVIGLTREIGREIGVNTLADIVRLETAIEYNMIHKFTMVRSLEMMTKLYDSAWAKNTFLMSRNIKMMVETCTNCSNIYLQILRDLEAKYGKRIPDKVMGNLIINRTSRPSQEFLASS